jgi:hypothetical protein
MNIKHAISPWLMLFVGVQFPVAANDCPPLGYVSEWICGAQYSPELTRQTRKAWERKAKERRPSRDSSPVEVDHVSDGVPPTTDAKEGPTH